MTDKICVIFGAGQEFPDNIIIPNGSLVIAADGGLNKLNDLDITPDRVIGDLDSLEKAPESGNFTLLPHVKDTTDTFEAVQEGLRAGAAVFHIYGGTGGRTDHTLANIQLAAQLSKQGKTAYIHGKDYIITAVTNGKVVLPARETGYVSVFAHSDICEGVTVKGLFYETDDIVLKNDFSLGVSNEYIGKTAEISVGNGTLIIYYEV